jgi:hypothetical protein
MFRNLTPDQQDAILKQLGSSGSGLSGILGGSGGLLGGQSTDRQQQDGQRQSSGQAGQPSDQDRSSQDEDQQPRIPVLKSEDWVVVEIDFHLAPRPVPLYLQSLYGSQALSQQSPPAPRRPDQAVRRAPMCN